MRNAKKEEREKEGRGEKREEGDRLPVNPCKACSPATGLPPKDLTC